MSEENLQSNFQKKVFAPDRFDLEQQIMECWNVTTDLRHVCEYLLDAPLEPNREDKMANMLLGMEELYNHKFDKMFKTFEYLIRSGKLK
jgi:hypothetical protein